MAIIHTGNIQPQLDMEEHAGLLDAKRVVLINKDTGAAYNADISAEIDSISLASVKSGVSLGVTITSGSTVAVSNLPATPTGGNYIGLASVNISPIPTGAAWIGLASISGKVDLNAGSTYIGLASVNVSPIPAGTAWIGLASIAGSVQISGTTKTIKTDTIKSNATGNATIFVPTNTFHVTHLLLSTASPCRVNIKSGVTYLVGNASIGVELAESGGWAQDGSTTDPLYDGLADASGFVIETSNDSPVAGMVRWFEE